MSERNKKHDLPEIRKNVLLFVISSIAFGVSLSFLAFSLPAILPEGTDLLYIFISAVIVVGALVFISVKLMIPLLRIDEAIYAVFSYDSNEGQVLDISPARNDYQDLAASCFHELSIAKPEHNSILKGVLGFDNPILNDFILIAILHWLSMLPMSHIFTTKTTVPNPPRIYRNEKIRQRTIHHADFTRGLQNIFLEIPSVIQSHVRQIHLPRNMELVVEKSKVTLKNRHLQVEVGYAFSTAGIGTDERIMKLLGYNENDSPNLSYISVLITFKAQMNPLSLLFSNGAVYWDFAHDMFEHLRATYDWGVTMDDLKDKLMWDALTNRDSEPED